MKQLQALLETLNKEAKLHQNEPYNYVIPESWNVYGYPSIRQLRERQLLVNPYAFYAFTLNKMFQDKSSFPMQGKSDDPSWIRRSVVYSFMVRSATAWDHDRDDVINHDNLYHLSDNGTFLKSIVLLPLLKRMGINTLLMHQPFMLGKTSKAHDYAAREAVIDFQTLDEELGDPILAGMNVTKQCAAFIEACHFFGMRVILEYCPAIMARDNAYFKEHPHWFYWIDEAYEKNYHAPICHALPQNTIPYAYTLKDLYRSEDTQAHIAMFRKAPSEVLQDDLTTVTKQQHITIAPSIVDQINANIPADFDTTILRFYDDISALAPADSAPYMLQDTIRSDLYSGKRMNNDLLRQLCKNITWYQKHLGIDGIYLEKPYLLPQKLQKDLVKTARKQIPSFVMIAEDSTMENGLDWLAKGYHAISGNSGYEETNIWDFKFHNFAYRLKGNECPMFAASEFHDSRRVSSLEHGKELALMLTVMNHFLPNGIPMLMNGIESFDVQPAQLSVYGDPKFIASLPREDRRYHRQSFLDQYYFDYLSYDLAILPNMLEKITQIRHDYLDAICEPEHCVPVWFDSPKDPGIGFTFIQDSKALMVVCNVNINQVVSLHIHTDNLLPQLPFKQSTIRQIYSTKDPYVHDITFDDLGNLPLSFESGEVKFIEFQ